MDFANLACKVPFFCIFKSAFRNLIAASLACTSYLCFSEPESFCQAMPCNRYISAWLEICSRWFSVLYFAVKSAPKSCQAVFGRLGNFPTFVALGGELILLLLLLLLLLISVESFDASLAGGGENMLRFSAEAGPSS